MTDDVLFTEVGSVGRIQLNRPTALNALTLEMCQAMAGRLRQWAVDPEIHAVVIVQSGRAFCAGGDIRKTVGEGRTYALAMLAAEYGLNALIKHYRKPFIALVDGIVMGGGVGISIHGSHRIVSGNVRFAMPEVGIGFFPDVGGSFFLSRMRGQLGLYLALTGIPLHAPDTIYCGYATHFVPADRFAELEAALLGHRGTVDEVISRFSTDPGVVSLAEYQTAIDRLFGGETLESVRGALARDPSLFASLTEAIMATKSPFSLKLAFREIRNGRRLDFDDGLRMEWRMASHMVDHADFSEGVRAMLVDKDRAPRWYPSRLADVQDDVVQGYFAARPGIEELDLG